MSLVLSLAASSTPAVTPEPEPEPEPEPDPMVESIDLDCETKNVKNEKCTLRDLEYGKKMKITENEKYSL